MTVCVTCGQLACSEIRIHTRNGSVAYYYCRNHMPRQRSSGISEHQFKPLTELEKKGLIQVKDPQI